MRADFVHNLVATHCYNCICMFNIQWLTDHMCSPQRCHLLSLYYLFSVTELAHAQHCGVYKLCFKGCCHLLAQVMTSESNPTYHHYNFLQTSVHQKGEDFSLKTLKKIKIKIKMSWVYYGQWKTAATKPMKNTVLDPFALAEWFVIDSVNYTLLWSFRNVTHLVPSKMFHHATFFDDKKKMILAD